MRSGIVQGEDGAPGVTRRVVRLLVLLSVGVAAYLVLSLFDHAARADTGPIDQIGAMDPVASVKAVTAGTRKAVPEPGSIIPKSTAPKAHPESVQRPSIKTPSAHAPKVQAAKKIHVPKIQPPRTRVDRTGRRAQARTVKLRQATSDAARDAVASARTAIVRQKLSIPAQLPSLPELPGLLQAALASGTRLLDLLPTELAALPQFPSRCQLPGLPQTQTPLLTPTTASSAPVPHQPLMPPASAQIYPLPLAFAPTPGLSGVPEPPAAQARPGTAPLPAPSRQPIDRSTSTGQARDSGGGNSPTMGTVSSSWRPDVAAAGRGLAIDLIARGRTVRYAGPPS